ncbi:aldehyde dehydrogenase [Thiospirochaeta perfilievii]|uniref:Aldehyde dehydrogenase n=1 Tax=Thiospirochaeta perfilievii TaxID=252967 RepID=A0A5C1Q7W1_9SPIO|nr:aldehyde dehydrogenase [Thiospirochaeta perfilievii]QEN04125.1 aldehyde dehydrogenase [Thiospirochaeta perfilievii]
MNIDKIIEDQRSFFNNGNTLTLKFRIDALNKLKESILYYENDIYTALDKDLNKSRLESYLTEIQMVLSEIKLTTKKLKRWMKPKRVSPGILNFPSKALIKPDPYGVALIISPWNYPFQLLFSPLVGAIAGGNTVLLKPSEISVATTEVSEKIIKRAFDPEYIAVLTGGVEVTTQLLSNKTDYIFFTGSTPVGKIVATAAARHLTPFTLELGGKSPCIIDKEVNLNRAVKRIVWGKLLNGGQTCVAPDYIYIHKDIKKTFIQKFIQFTTEFYGDNPISSNNYCKIISENHFKRLVNLLDDGQIVYGGESNKESLKINPTLIENCSDDSPIMVNEIFGPIFPIKTFENIEEVPVYIRKQGKPLALYIFSKNRKNIEYILNRTTSGGVSINDTISHLIPHDLPFGGVGESGNGAYHGYESFNTFTHSKSILKKGDFDPKLKFPPYSNEHKTIKLFKKFF